MAAQLSEKTKLSLNVGMAASLVGTLVVCTYTLTGAKDELITRIDVLEREQYSITQAAEAALREAIENPGHRVPDPRDPSSVIEVRPRIVP